MNDNATCSEERHAVYPLDSLVQSWQDAKKEKQQQQNSGIQKVVTAVVKEQEPVPRQEKEKQEKQTAQTKSSGLRRRMVGGAAMLAVLLGVVIVVAVLVAGKRDTGGSSSERYAALLPLFEQVSSTQSLETLNTPQNLALNWMVDHDSAAGLSQRELQERYILSVFFFSTSGQNWRDSFGFLSELHVCQWNSPDFGMGVTCAPQQTTVQAIKMGPNNLQGTLPPELFLLSGLESLQLVMNPGLVGTLPTTIEGAESLKILNLNENSLTGTVPETLVHLPSLQTLWMDQNSFEGKVPTIPFATKLQWFSCTNCGLEGDIPVNLQYPTAI